MTPIPLPLVDGDTLLLDNSSIEKVTTCPRSAELGLCHKLQGAGDRVALRFGGIAHKCLEVRYRSGAPMYEQTPTIQQAMIVTAADEFSRWQPPEDEYRNYDRMVDLIHNYGLQYPFEDFQIPTFPDGKLMVEVPFAYPLGTLEVNCELWIRNPDRSIEKRFVKTIKIIWIGKIDLPYILNGQLFLMDHKTSSMATNMDEFLISHQFYGYAWALEQMLSRKVDGVIINRIVCRKPTKTGIPFTFERKYIPIGRGLLAEWKLDCLHIIADFIEGARRGYMPKHTSHCVAKFGTCEFHKICQLDDPAQRAIMLTSGEYTERTWSPLKEQA